MFWDEKVLEPSELGNYKVARALSTPAGYNKGVFALSDLDPITKIQEETFYHFVKKSIEDFGYLYQPLLVYPISIQDWEKEMEMDPDQTPPPDRGGNHLRVQVGCNRYYALLELGYTAAECIVEPVLSTAWDVAQAMRVDKRWQRGSNMISAIEAYNETS